MTGIQECERARLWIKVSIEQSYKTIRGNAFNQVAINRGNRFSEGLVSIELRVNRGVQRRHQQSRSGSFARHVTERDNQISIRSLDEVVVVAADFLTGKADALQFITRHLWRRSWLKALLNFAGDLKLAFKTFALELLFSQPGVFNANGGD